MIPANTAAPAGAAAPAAPATTATLLSATRPAATTPAATTPAQLCVRVTRDEASVQRGHTAQWTVSAWAKGGTVPSVVLRLATTPSSQTPKFTFGCAHDGTNSCALGTVDSNSTPREFRAQVAIAANATSVKSVKLTVTGSSNPKLTKNPAPAVTIPVTAPSASSSPSSPGVSALTPSAGITSALPVGTLPSIGSGAALSPGGNASGLFPTIQPSANSPGGKHSGSGLPRTRPVANTLPGDASVIGAQLAGLIALALAFVLAVTRLSLQRRPAAVRQSAGEAIRRWTRIRKSPPRS